MTMKCQLRALATDRRRFLLGGGALSLVPWVTFAAEEQSPLRNHLPAGINPFTLGVASGDPSSDGFVIWTRLAPSPLDGGGMPPEIVEVRWEISETEDFRKMAQEGVAHAVPQLAHSVHVEVEGLAADRWYWYRFRVGEVFSPMGRARTCPAPNILPEQLRFALTSCQNFEDGYYTGFQRMAEEELDLVVHLGDYIYEFKSKNDRVRKHHGEELHSLEDYRNRHAQYKSDPWLQGMHARCPWVVVWDDHEVDNNYAGSISEEREVKPADFLLRRANAYQAYYEHMPLRRRSVPHGPFMRAYRSIPYGRLVHFQMLDTRQYRSDQPQGDGSKPLAGDVYDPQSTVLGDRQEGWLMGSLLRSTAQWNVLAQQIMMARVDRAAGAEALYSMDQWSGYEVARNRLLRFCAERRIPNPVVLTGDIHSNWVNDLFVDFDRLDSAPMATEFVCTSISSGGNGKQNPDNLPQLQAENPFVKFHNQERGYVSCTVTPKSWQSDYQAIEYVDRPDAPRITRASFTVESGRAGVNPHAS
jgi:alkaline phosphatase D